MWMWIPKLLGILIYIYTYIYIYIYNIYILDIHNEKYIFENIFGLMSL